MSPARTLRVATRGSALALWQTRWITKQLGIEVEEVILKTSGEQKLDVPIHALGGQGVFVKELQTAVLDGRADFAVHSAKDLPSFTIDGLVLASIPERGEVRDCLVGKTIDDIPIGGTVGTGSVRRRAQLAAIRPDLAFGNLRGNIDTRLEKAKDFDAIVLAAVALQRLDHDDRITQLLDTETMLPQVGQGALAVECRSDDEEVTALLQTIEDPDSRKAVDAERAFLNELGGACDFPEGAYAVVDNGQVTLRTLLASLDGKTVLRHEVTGDDPIALGIGAAKYLLDEAGGKALLDVLRAPRS